MRWSSAQPSRISNAEVNYAPFLLVPLAQILAGFSYGAGGFYDARDISTAGPRPAKGTFRETPDFLSHDTGRWTLHLLQRDRAERRTDASPATRASFLIPDVRTPILSPVRSLSPYRARLPRLWPQRLARPENICVHVRSHRRNHESLHRSSWALALHALHAGLRRPRGFSHGLNPSGSNRGSHRPGCCGAQRGPGRDLEDASGLLGRPRRQRKRASYQPAVSADDADAPCRKRSQRGTL